MISIEKERSKDRPAIEALLDLAFGPGRFAKSSYRLREGTTAIDALCFVGFVDGVVKGSIRFWPVRVGDSDTALLLGPLAVDPALRGQGLGIALIERGLDAAKKLGHNIVFLVGDEPYYARCGFSQTEPGRFGFPGPVDPARLLWTHLNGPVADTFRGAIQKDG